MLAQKIFPSIRLQTGCSLELDEVKEAFEMIQQLASLEKQIEAYQKWEIEYSICTLLNFIETKTSKSPDYFLQQIFGTSVQVETWENGVTLKAEINHRNIMFLKSTTNPKWSWGLDENQPS